MMVGGKAVTETVLMRWVYSRLMAPAKIHSSEYLELRA
jgi:hypothetical protein